MPKNNKKKPSHNLITRAQERKLIRLVDATRTNQAEAHIEVVHNNGFLVLGIGEPTEKDRYKWSQWGYKKEDLNNNILQNILGYEYNTYLTINSFKSPIKTLSNLYSLNALWSDIDYYKVIKYADKTYLEMIEIISKNKLIKKAPPSFWVYSGQGIYPLWLIKDAHAGACLPLWNRIMREIQEALKPYGADPGAVEAAHFLRLPGSNNTKSGNIAKIIKDDIVFNPKRYTLKELSELILDVLPYSKSEWQEIKKKKRKTKKEKKSCKVTSIFNIHSLNFARMQDMQTLIELRKGDCIGTRERMLFLYRYWANCYHKCDETALSEILRLNDMFKEPLSESEVVNATKNAAEAASLWEKQLNEYLSLDEKPSVKKFFYDNKSGAYIYSNKKLILDLKIEQEEMKSLRTIFNNTEKLRRKNEKRKADRRNENGLNSREQAKVDKILAIGELIEKGLKNKDIVNRLNLTKGTVSKYSKEYLNNKEYYLLFKTDYVNNDKTVEFARVTDNELNLLIV